MKIKGTQRVEVEIDEYQEKSLLVDLLKKRMGLKDGGHLRMYYDDMERKPEVIIEMLDVGFHKTEMEVTERRPATEYDLAAWKVIVAIQEGKL